MTGLYIRHYIFTYVWYLNNYLYLYLYIYIIWMYDTIYVKLYTYIYNPSITIIGIIMYTAMMFSAGFALGDGRHQSRAQQNAGTG